MSGGGGVFDACPCFDESGRGFPERFVRGEKAAADRIDPSDFETGPVEPGGEPSILLERICAAERAATG